MIEWITDYIELVRKNPKRFCDKIKKLVNLVEKLLKRKDIEYKKSDPVAFEEFCRKIKHKEGALAGQPFILNQEQRFMAACVLGIKWYSSKHSRWLRYFTEFNLFVARKFGKTLFISALALWLLGFDKEGGAFGEILAENEVQSKKLYKLVCRAAEQACFHGIFKENRTEKFLECKLNEGQLVYLSGRGKGKQGSNPSFFINDEANEITRKTQYSDKKQGMGARVQPLAIVISSAGVTPDSLYEMLYERDEKILKRKSFNDKERIFPVIYEIDDNDKVEDESCWIKANPCMDRDLPSLNYLQQLYETSKDNPVELAKFTAFNLNRQIGAALEFFELSNIKEAMGTIKTEDIYNSYAVGGVDLSETTDLCNATLTVLKEDGSLVIVQAYFIAESVLQRNSERDKTEYKYFQECKSDCEAVRKLLIVTNGTYVDQRDVLKWFVYMRDTYQINILKIGYDRWMSKEFIHLAEDFGFNEEKTVKDINDNDVRDYGILTSVAQGGYTLSGAIKIIKELFKQNKLMFDKTNKLLPYCFYNLRIRFDTNNNITPHKAKSTGHIDGAVGLFIAFVAYQRAKPLYEAHLPDLFQI